MNALLGRCDITLLTNRQEIEAAEIHYVRPELEQALIGLEPQNAIDVLGHLPNACRISHQLAASYVLGCSTGTLLRQVNHEWINTHAMQLFLMLNKLGWKQYADSATSALIAGQWDISEQLFGMSAELTVELIANHGVIAWLESTDMSKPYPKLLSWALRYGWQMDYQILKHSNLYQRHASTLSISEKMQDNVLFLLILSRVYELALLLSDHRLSGQWQFIKPTVEAGGVRVNAPHGELYHQAVVGWDNKIVEYQIITPTDRLCEPDGLFDYIFQHCELPENDPTVGLDLLVGALEPCVNFQYSLQDVQHTLNS
ncbi:hypothetical protein Q8W16_01210 [Photobacterium damselae subsp. piscicida]|nr:hypothetical protein [Photobacterium damselae subsp. piscicida]